MGLLLSYLHLIVFIAYIYLVILALTKHPQATLNRVAAALLTSFAIWSFGKIFLHNPNTSKEVVAVVVNINAIGWTTFGALFLIFALVFSGHRYSASNRVVYFGLLTFPMIFLYKQWTNGMVIDWIHFPFGWASVWEESLWTLAFDIYYLSTMVLGLIIFYVEWRYPKNSIKKKQSRIMFFSGSLALVFGFVLNGLFHRIDIYSVPELGNWAGLIWGFGMTYAIVKYNFMAITPALAADKILATMSDFLILLNFGGEIVTINEATLNALGYTESELLGKPFSILTDNETPFIPRILWEPLNNQRFTMQTKHGRSIPVLLSSIPLCEEEQCSGIVCVAKDISELKRTEKQREAVIVELREALDKVNTLKGLIPICSACKKIRDDQGYWHQLEVYIRDHSDAEFSHGMCEECAKEFYPDFTQ